MEVRVGQLQLLDHSVELEGDGGGPYELEGDGGGPYELDGEADVEVEENGPLFWLFLMLQTSRPSREVFAGHPNCRTSVVRNVCTALSTGGMRFLLTKPTTRQL